MLSGASFPWQACTECGKTVERGQRNGLCKHCEELLKSQETEASETREEVCG